jgi:hypothetical protein
MDDNSLSTHSSPQVTEMEIVLLLVLLVVIGGGGYYVAHRPTVTPE